MLMCLGAWSVLGFVKDSNVKSVTLLPDLNDGEEEAGLEEDWDMVL